MIYGVYGFIGFMGLWVGRMSGDLNQYRACLCSIATYWYSGSFAAGS